jgi:hypothetical protein
MATTNLCVLVPVKNLGLIGLLVFLHLVLKLCLKLIVGFLKTALQLNPANIEMHEGK